jgi:DNA polymerase elongation subunit (family B)
MEPIRGLYRNLNVADIVSLYSSMAIVHKISFDTVNCRSVSQMKPKRRRT